MKINARRTSPSPFSGFTIVELLIVVIVVAILATITIMSFNGITKRAEYTSIAVTVRAYKDAFAIHKINNGALPFIGGPVSRGACLGEGYPNYDGDAAGDCRSTAYFTGFDYNEDSTLSNAVRPHLPDLPTIQKDGFTAGGHRYNGLIYFYDPNIRVDGVWAPRVILFYTLPGQNVDCQVPVLRYVGSGSNVGVGGNPSDYLFTSANPNRWSASNAHSTACVYLLD